MGVEVLRRDSQLLGIVLNVGDPVVEQDCHGAVMSGDSVADAVANVRDQRVS
jgi:hypothetical protein